MPAECLTFEPLYMERIWGGRKLQSYFGRTLPGTNPIGESWELVDREDAQSIVSESTLRGVSLHEIWTNYREELFGEGYDFLRFPILVKILDASDILSLQVHPGQKETIDDLAEPKAEIWYIVAAEEQAGNYIGLKQNVRRIDFESAVKTGNVLNLLHWVPSQRDSYIFIPGGRLHAIGAGNVIFEIQQNSDTTYRVFDWNRLDVSGKPRQLHVEESLRCINFNDFEPALSKGDGENLVTCDGFRVDRWFLKEDRQANLIPKFSIFQVVRGIVSFGRRRFGRGDLFLVPAGSHESALKPHEGTATVLRTTL
ncbi:MAG: class I mannose-6-phosphate isomerase [Verrucomicrobia bacterium]|nr:class I mannose-6-phosphate isomerase [Verrucomicrobiota bacterium]